jgi:hypothetical protein
VNIDGKNRKIKILDILKPKQKNKPQEKRNITNNNPQKSRIIYFHF